MTTKEDYSIKIRMDLFISDAIIKWQKELFFITEDAKEDGDFWMFTKEASDMFSHSNVLVSELQAKNKNNILIEKSINEIRESLTEIISSNPLYSQDLEILFSDLCRMEDYLISF